MARITVEDCLKRVDNRFELVLAAAKRARQLSDGAEPLVPWENDKVTVVALREIADDLIDIDSLDAADHEEEAAEEMAAVAEPQQPGEEPQQEA